MQFQVFYGEYNVMYGPNGVDLSAFKRTSSGIDKPLERSFGSICKWLQRGFHVDPLTHVITVQSLVNWEVDSELWELMMIHSTDDWQKYMQAALERGWPLAILVQIREKTQNEIQHCADLGTPSIRRPGSYSLQYVFIPYINLIVTIHMFHCQLKPLILIVYAACPVGCGCRRVR